MIEVLQPGLLTTIQDLGRRGYENYGVPPSGALDPFLASVANKLVGNDLNSPLLEFALVGPTLMFRKDCWVGVAGFDVRYLLNGKPADEFTAFPVPAGSVLQFSGMQGWFGYLAVSGGILCERILGSASTYISGRIGNRLRKGALLEVGETTEKYFSVRRDFLGFRATNILSILPALHTSGFSMQSRHKLAENDYTITLQSNRMGIRLEGAPIKQPKVRRSAPALPGTIQVPRSGDPLILGPEGPTTGGYPQIAVLPRTSWTKLAQTRPREKIRFEWTSVESARQIWSHRNSIFSRDEAWQRI